MDHEEKQLLLQFVRTLLHDCKSLIAVAETEATGTRVLTIGEARGLLRSVDFLADIKNTLTTKNQAQ